MLVWNFSLLLSLWASRDHFRSWGQAYWNHSGKLNVFIFSKWIKWNSNILSVCFFHSSQHLGLGPYHPTLFLPVLRFFLPFLLHVMTTGVSSLKKFFRNISELEKTGTWLLRLTAVLLSSPSFASHVVLLIRTSPVAQLVLTAH